MDYTYHPNKG